MISEPGVMMTDESLEQYQESIRRDERLRCATILSAMLEERTIATMTPGDIIMIARQRIWEEYEPRQEAAKSEAATEQESQRGEVAAIHAAHNKWRESFTRDVTILHHTMSEMGHEKAATALEIVLGIVNGDRDVAAKPTSK